MQEIASGADCAPPENNIPWWEQVIESTAGDLRKTPCNVFDKTALTVVLSEAEERQREILSFVTNLWISTEDYDTRCPLRLIVEVDESDTREVLCNHLDSRFEEISFVQAHTRFPEVKARLSELLWSYRRKHRVALSVGVDAVNSYLAACAPLQVNSKTSSYLCARFARALRLSTNLPDKTILVKAKDAWLKALREEVSSGGHSLLLKTARILVGKPSPIQAELAELLVTVVEGFESVGMFSDVEEELCDLAAKFNAAAPAQASALRVKGAALALGRAKLMVARDQQGFVGLLMARQAVAKLKLAQAPTSLMEEGVELLHFANSKIEEEHFETITSVPIDCTREVKMYQALVSNCRTEAEALANFCELALVPELTELEKEVADEAASLTSVSGIFTSVTWSPDGRSVEEPSPHSSDPAERERALTTALHRKAKWYRGVYTNLAVKSCLAQLKLDHSEGIDNAVKSIVSQSRFIPESRKELFLRGLKAGFQGNFVEALHYIIPQLEACLRHQIECSKVPAITPSRDARDVQVILFEQIFGRIEGLNLFSKDLVFNLRGLLTEEAGGNLRNRHCHGLLEEADYGSNDAVYLWWLALRLAHQTR